MTAAQKIMPDQKAPVIAEPALDDIQTANDKERLGAPRTVLGVLAAYDRLGLPYMLRKLESAPSTPEELAQALGTEVDYIVLATVFRGKATRKPVLLLHSAATRVSDKLLAQVVGENLQRAESEFILRHTGFTIESVPPVGHLNRVPLILDSALTRLARVWTNAGAPDYHVALPTLALARAISARLVQLSI